MGGTVRRIAALLVGALVALHVRAAPAAAPAATGCDAPPALVAPEEPLSHSRAALHGARRLDILAVGSGSLLGPQGGARGSLPDRMVQALSTSAPGTSVKLTVLGERAETAAEMLAALKRELARRPYQLVVWQTGTVEALRRKPPPPQFQATLVEGAQAVAAAGADLMLIDLPYSRLLQDKADLAPYQDAIADVAARADVLRFPRFALMHAWSDAGVLDLESVPRKDRRAAAERLRDCLGQALARFVVAATQESR